MRITRRSAVPLIGLGLTGAWPGSGKVYPPSTSSAATPFNPASLITGGGGFWRADMGVTQSGTVTQWNDQSSFGNNLTVPAAASGGGPAFSSTGFNTSFPGMTFIDQTAVGLTKTGVSFASTTVSIFMLCTAKNSTGQFSATMTIHANGANNFTTPSMNCDCGNTNGVVLYEPYSAGALGNGGSPLTLTNNTNYLLGTVLDGAHASLWQNGSAIGAQTAFSSTIGSNPNEIGFGVQTAGAQAAACILAFWGVTQKAMNSTDWGNLKTWTNSNWGTSF